MKAKSIFYCTDCGNESAKWSGQCSVCGAWNTLVEQKNSNEYSNKKSQSVGKNAQVTPLESVEVTEELRVKTGIGELDRVLGGGAVKGSLVLIGGAPGIGKSTLMLQICHRLCQSSKVLYVSGEESVRQIKIRAQRLNIHTKELYLLSETRLDNILQAVEMEQPDILVIDSIQTIYQEELSSPAGSVGQVKECTMTLMRIAKGEGITCFVIGHVNKEGAIAGPKVLEHMVDCVLYFEGERHMNYRILRAAKNRFGTTNEIGVFEMQNAGLMEIENPSEVLLSGHPYGVPGTCVTCVMEGARPILAEIQTLLAPSSLSVPRRSCNGFEFNRAAMLLAVLEKRGRMKVSSCDVYINIVGGLSLEEPAADLAALLAIASSYLDRSIGEKVAAIGEVGLTGELRSVSCMEQRLSEVWRLGFQQCVIPACSLKNLSNSFEGLSLICAENIVDVLRNILHG